MTDYSISFDRLFNPTKLFLHYLNGGLKEFYRYNFLDDKAPAIVADDIEKTNYNRGSIHDIILNANRMLGASDSTLANIELLKDPATLCVFAGQQTAFCANPMYVVYKALTAVKLAKRFSNSMNRPVVPCFWMATDDHDFEEVRSANFILRSGETVKVTYNPARDPAGIPVAGIVLDDGVEDFCRATAEAMIDTEFKQPLLNEFHKVYRKGKKLSEAFAHVFNHFMGKWGIILVDPNFPEMKQLFRPIFLKEISEYEQTFKVYEDRCERLHSEGYHIQVHKSGENLNLFYHSPKRTNIVIENGSFIVDGNGTRFTKEQLLNKVRNSPDIFSSNVLLRPIAQCHAFPTLAHVVGPSELAYFAQIEPLFEYFNVPFPIAYPRGGMTIIEPHIKKIIDKYDLNLAELKNNLELAIGTVIDRLFPSEAAGNLVTINECINRDLDKLSEQLKDSDPEGRRHVNNFKKRIDYELKQLHKKLKATNKKRHEELTNQIRKVYAFLFPNCGLQERLISPFYFANKFGLDIFDRIYDALEVDKPVHSVLEL